MDTCRFIRTLQKHVKNVRDEQWYLDTVNEGNPLPRRVKGIKIQLETKISFGMNPIIRYLEKRENIGLNHIADRICEQLEESNLNGFNGQSIDEKANRVWRTYQTLIKLDKEVLNRD